MHSRESEHDDESVALSVFQDEHDIQSHHTLARRFRCGSYRWGLCTLLLLVVIALLTILGRDIKQTAELFQDSIALDNVLFNIRDASPVISADLQVAVSPRYSEIRLREISCQSTSGNIHVNADYHSETEGYSLTVTCPPDDVTSHAAFLRDTLTVQSVPWEVHCQIHVLVKLGGVLPVYFTHGVDYCSKKNEHDSEGAFEQHHRSLSSAYGTKGRSSSFSSHSSLMPSIVVETWGLDTLKVRLAWAMIPASSYVKSVQILLPSLQVYVKADGDTEALTVTWDEFEATLVSSQRDESHSMVLEIACHDGTHSCHWFQPLTDTMFEDSNRPTEAGTTSFRRILVSVEAAGSFLEQIVGSTHFMTLQKFMRPASSPEATQFGWRRLMQQASALPKWPDASSDCLRLTPNEAPDVEFSLCFAIDADDQNKGSVFSSCNMTFYETSLLGLASVEWNKQDLPTETTLQIHTGAVLAEPHAWIPTDAKVNIGGILDIRVPDNDDSNEVEVDWNLENSGAWLPFATSVSFHGVADDDVLDVTVKDVTVILDSNQHFKQAQGSLTVDADAKALRGALSDEFWEIHTAGQVEGDVKVPVPEDPYVPDGVSPLNKDEFGKIPLNFLRGNSTARKGTDIMWDAALNVELWSLDFLYITPVITRDLSNTFFDLKFEEAVKDLVLDARLVLVDTHQLTAAEDSAGNVLDAILDSVGSSASLSYYDIILDHLILHWDTTTYLDSAVDIRIVPDDKKLSISASDAARLDMQTDIQVSWFSESTESTNDRLVFDRFQVTNNDQTKVFVNLASGDVGVLSQDGAEASITFTSAPGALLDVEGSLGYTWTEESEILAATVDGLKMDWKSDALLDMSGDATLNLDQDTVMIRLVDENTKNFEADMVSSWYSNSVEDWGLMIDKISVKKDTETWLDSTGSFRLTTTLPETEVFQQDNGNPMGVLEITSLSAAMMELDMDMNFILFEDDEFFQLVMNRCRMEYQKTVYIDVGSSAPIVTVPEPTTAPATTPALSPPSAPNIQVFNFTGITMFIAGAPDFSEEDIQVLEAILVEFYTLAFANTPSRRKLEAAVSNLETSVQITKDSPSSRGNTITYDQSISFAVANGQTMSYTDARTMLVSPFVDEAKKEEFVKMLKENPSPSFTSITGVAHPDVPWPEDTVPPNNDDDDNGALVPILIVFGVLLCCCCAGGGAFVWLQKNRQRQSVTLYEKGLVDDDELDSCFQDEAQYEKSSETEDDYDDHAARRRITVL